MTIVDPSITEVASQAVSAILPVLPPSKAVPSSFGTSVKHWWATGDKEAAIAEERLLRRLPYFRPSTVPPLTADESPVTATSSLVTLDGPKRFLNQFSITATAPSPDAPPPTVVLHGYGAGLGFFFQNYPALGAWVGRRGAAMYALDWLGMGRSARVPFGVTAARADTDARVAQAEAFFVDALEEWRVRVGIERFQLVGHSLGGYLGCAYALRHPERVARLVLVSPAGIPHGPEGIVPSREVTESQDETINGPGGVGHSAAAGAQPAVEATRPAVERVRSEQEAQKRKETRTRRLLTYLWEEGWSPFQVVRSIGFWGPLIIGKYSSRRFSGLTEEDTNDMHDYIQQITLAKGSGEYCISHILAPGAYARKPMVDRIAPLKIPVTFIYGEHDWMDPKGGYESVANLRKAGNTRGRMFIVPNAGHHVYLDNPKAVNDLLVKELDSAL